VCFGNGSRLRSSSPPKHPPKVDPVAPALDCKPTSPPVRGVHGASSRLRSDTEAPCRD
jgi:hypothetical protein